jgi:SAM-dependent methyltransferase
LNSSSRRGFRLAVLLLGMASLVGALAAASWTAEALRRVDAVEAERDGWQRAAGVLQALDVGEGGTVADLGCGVGYFALKLSDRVGKEGRVLAVDVRRFPLLFLRIRALRSGRGNIQTMVGDADDPRLPVGVIDAVLVSNTYHEIAHPERVLERLFESLRPGGRLVIVDPAPEDEAGPAAAHAHGHRTAASTEAHLVGAGFDVVGREDRFVERDGEAPWWLVVARRPLRASGAAVPLGQSAATR